MKIPGVLSVLTLLGVPLLFGETLLDYSTGKPVRYAGRFSAAPVVRSS